MRYREIHEMSYEGNVGMMEMFRFYQVATPEQKAKMKLLIAGDKTQEAWEFLQAVTGVKLKN
jgi:Spy/CpxP family protein refolding chaperone